MIWITWIDIVWKLRNAFSRQKTFYWFVISLIGFSTRIDQLGIASIIRSLGMGEKSYECLRQFFHSSSTDLGKLTLLWSQAVNLVLKDHFCLFKGRKVYLIDGIKVAKEGRRMAGLKWLHQDSQNSSKASYIFGHSCQALHVLVKAKKSYLAIPLVMRIHEGLGNRRGSLVMRILDFLYSVKVNDSYIVGDAYYWSGKFSQSLRSRGNYLVSRVKLNAVAYTPLPSRDLKNATKTTGRPKKYGEKRKLINLFKGPGFKSLTLLLYGKNQDLEYKEVTLMCKNHQSLIKYVFTKINGNYCIFASTDLELTGPEIIELYSYRFKIEFSFKEFVHDFGGFKYRFWSKSIERSRKRGVTKRSATLESAYHLHLQIAVISHGLANIVAILHSAEIWELNSLWMRTIRPGLVPSAAVVRIALREGLRDLSKLPDSWSDIIKFIEDRRNLDKKKEVKLVA